LEERRFQGAYVIKVGDVCFTLVGQIINRRLSAARYQPTGILIVNSPIETPELAAALREDWTGLTPVDHRADLIEDIRAQDKVFLYGAAFVRLRFYYPDAYLALTGDDLAKRKLFEADEAKSIERELQHR
jgi:hypothetical protein